MFLEEEVYEMLNWGFGFGIGLQLILFIGIWIRYKYDTRSFINFIVYILLFSVAGYNLLLSINTIEAQTGFGSEEASFNMGVAGVFWILSALFLLMGVNRLVKSKRNI
ncbi:hypothetical protein [Ornithinibacillus scapharcae]|uniref:hypothetical protein n=1 Tax=Ornithinibacillus scapharcae TaxID=1147159 RepID=UPI000225BB7C|nr:hypothetical protein [Ornithinibacillus scapharcae]